VLNSRPVLANLKQSICQACILAVLLTACSAQKTPVAPPAPEPTATGTEQSLGNVAQKSKKQASVKKVITEDDMNAAANILPRIKNDGPENADEIIAAIGEFRKSHTPEQTEDVVEAWYERYDQDLGAAIQQSLTMKTLREENYSNENEMCREGGDYEKCEKQRRAEYIGVRHDQLTLKQNAELEVRIQHVFMKVRIGIQRYNLRYPWFRIRANNGIDTY